jgi:signal transduction histidine kinase
MQNVPVLGVVAAGLLAAQAVLVLIRTSSCVRRSIPVFLAAFLLLLSMLPFLQSGSLHHDLVLVALLWTSGAFLIRVSSRAMWGTWTGSNIAFACTLLISRALGYGNSISYTALRSFGIVILAAVPLGILFTFWQKNRPLPSLLTFSVGCFWLGLAGIRVAGGIEFPRIPELLLAFCTGWLIFLDGYPERSAWNGSLPGLTPREGMLHSLHTRLLDTENALIDQEKAASAGFLALGAAHEFKNILSLVRLSATHGLGQPDPAMKDKCLRLIVEHTNTARDSAIDVLERLSLGDGEKACTLDAARDLTGSLRRAGAALRAEGIVVEIDLGAGVIFRARKSDVERILLNLLHNAAECYRRCPADETRIISISARSEDEYAVMEVADSAGGMDESIRSALFSPSLSGSGGTGYGLYLSRNLALSNQGSLDYRPVEGGSVFVLSLPAALSE